MGSKRKTKRVLKVAKQQRLAENGVSAARAKVRPQTSADSFLDFTTFKAAIAIAVVGLAVYCSGLGGQFVNDDNGQIVTNVPVHSITNIGTFFAGGTFYNGQGGLYGNYYRPLMMTVFSAVYSLFGANPLWFHLLQLLLFIACAFVLFLVLGTSCGLRYRSSWL
jgi:hypothetical protein